MANERKTIVTYKGTGSQKVFAFPFDYLRKSFIKVMIDGNPLTYGTDYTVSDKQLTFTNAPVLNAIIVIYRETTTDRLVAWEDASVLRAGDLTLFEVQLLHIAEETQDKVQESGLAKDDYDGIWDARLTRIKNVLDPVDALDVVNLQYIQNTKNSLITTLNNTKDVGVTTINNARDSAINTINTTKENAVASVNLTRDSAITNVTASGDILISQMNTLKTDTTNEANRAKNEADRAANSAAQAQTLAETLQISDTPQPGKILKLDANAKLPASITGDAATVGGYAPGTAANNVLVLDNSGKVPTANLPVLSTIPTGIICMWSGSASNIPSGWHLCDGTNGTPDLRDRFVLGAGGSYAVGATGGEATHTLTIAEMPSHNHTYEWRGSSGNGYGAPSDSAVDMSKRYNPTSSVGGGQPHNNMPPYYALCYIMKL